MTINIMTRHDAYKLLTEMMSNKNLIRHGLAVEAIMRDLCKKLKDREKETDSGLRQNDKNMEFNEEEWAIVGLLHDADYELIKKDPTRHTLVTEEKLRALGETNQRIINGIKAHHEGIKDTRDNLMEKAVYAADELSGLITAVALVRPDKKLSSVTVESVLKKFPEKAFAAGAKREQITKGAKELDLTLEELTAIALKSMQAISVELGL